uniref:Uncharacterized protein n=1 Tax=Catharus ustulatus TaxID=91951 RepID=A0A8C3V1X0_CATUS
MFTLPWPSFRGTVDDNVVIKDFHHDLLHPQGQGGVPVLVLGRDSECGERVRALHPGPGDGGAQHQLTAALEVEGVAIEGQVVPVARDDAGGVEFSLRLTRLEGATGHVLAEDLIVEVQAAALGGAVGVIPKDLPLAEKLS